MQAWLAAQTVDDLAMSANRSPRSLSGSFHQGAHRTNRSGASDGGAFHVCAFEKPIAL